MSDPKSTMPPTDTLQDLARRAGPIARNAQLIEINLRKLDTELFVEPADATLEATLNSEHSVEHAFSLKTETSPNLLGVTVRFRVTVVSNEDKNQLCVMNAIFLAKYVFPDAMPVDVVKDMGAFAQTNTLIHVWPYYRELVQSTFWRMGIPPFPLPLFRITDPAKQQEDGPSGTASP